jgi:hypothetical protein
MLNDLKRRNKMSEQVSLNEKILTRYAEGVNRLDELLSGLSESGLDLSRDQGKWTIRQIVHHIVDAKDLWETFIKAALGNPGYTVDMNWYILDNKCAPLLDYARRPIKDGVELFRAIRRHIVELVKCLPDAWGRFAAVSWSGIVDGKTFKVGDVIGFQCSHLEHHIKQIRETRDKHGV